MIKERMGDLLESNADILAHQTNCIGVMGAGIARQFKDKLLDKSEYEKYVSLCQTFGSGNLGTVQLLNLKNGKLLANLFGENVPTKTEVDTDYDAIKKALENLRDIAEKEHLSVAFPGYMACGLAGGDWDIVFDMIETIFIDCDVEIVYHPSNVIEETCTLMNETEMYEFSYPIYRGCQAWVTRTKVISYVMETRHLLGDFCFIINGKISDCPYRTNGKVRLGGEKIHWLL